MALHMTDKPNYWWIVDPWLTVVEGSCVTAPFPIEDFPDLDPSSLATLVVAHLRARRGDVAVVDVTWQDRPMTVTVSASTDGTAGSGLISTIAAANESLI